jgi:hypothetical protein
MDPNIRDAIYRSVRETMLSRGLHDLTWQATCIDAQVISDNVAAALDRCTCPECGGYVEQGVCQASTCKGRLL